MRRVLPFFLLLAAAACRRAPSAAPVQTPPPPAAQNLPPAPAEPARPSEASIERLLEATQAHRFYNSMISQLGPVERRMVDQAARLRHFNPTQRAELLKRCEPLFTQTQADLTWDKVKAAYVKVYADAFTPAEVEQIVAFYESPAGKAVVQKLPFLLQRGTAALRPQIGRAIQEANAAVQKAATAIAGPEKKGPGEPRALGP